MRSTELHGERRGLNLHLEAWVVRFRLVLPESLDLQKCAEPIPKFYSAPCLRSGGKKGRWCCASGSRWRAARPDGIFRKSLIARSALPEPACNHFDRMFQQLFRRWCPSIPYVALFLFLPAAPDARLGAACHSKHGMRSGYRKLERSWCQEEFCYFLLRQPQAARGYSSSAMCPAHVTTR